MFSGWELEIEAYTEKGYLTGGCDVISMHQTETNTIDKWANIFVYSESQTNFLG